ncbi:hypothetical protein ACSFA3_21155 [Variovorax sp. RHLX14]|uniref:hypothetical protein n=1 Tax=Variovorax sp. RHLX14 TaxID=1259731 RepID=UPI003F46D92B
MGLSSKPEGGYDKKTQGRRHPCRARKIGIDKADIVGHNIGTIGGLCIRRALSRPDHQVGRDGRAGSWRPAFGADRAHAPAVAFGFGGKDALRLVKGRDRIYLDRFWNVFAANPTKIDEGTRAHYAKLYAQSGAMRAAFAQFLSIQKDAKDNVKSVKTRLTMPVLAITAARSRLAPTRPR